MKKFLIMLLGVFIITGCSSTKKEDAIPKEAPEMLDVSIQTPDTINPNEEVTIEAHVTQGNENVDDANEVNFEIWLSGQDDHEMLDGKHQGKGIYSVKKTFVEDGTYFIIAHVTARDMHNMPKKEITVGTPDESTEAEHENSEEEHHHAHSSVSIEFQPNNPVTANKEVTLSAKVKNENETLAGAKITFEIWKENEEKHEFIDAVEGNNGEYTLVRNFSTPGKYNVQVHVRKGEIHEHQEESIEVVK